MLRLCCAVSIAGRLGVIGAASFSPELLRLEIRKTCELARL
jgi:NAD(P)H-dependent flavin oxidoreductase YrpB (nitropropane dioxygenase family)